MSAHSARLARARRELIRQLRRGNAFSAAAARPLETTNDLERRVLQRMMRNEVIRPGAKGGYWLDEERYADWKRRHYLTAFGIALVMGGLVACLAIYAPDHPRHARDSHTAAIDTTAADSLNTRHVPSGD